MKTEKLILISELEKHYELNNSFFNDIQTYDLLEVHIVSNERYLHRKHLKNFEKILHLHNDLAINFEGIDVILNLMQRIESLRKELHYAKTTYEL
ncbi:MAG: hypothetical protein H6553_07020 [Chitinophagales bacterium]|nr:hypothetical protein [Chitinophagales bacterium]